MALVFKIVLTDDNNLTLSDFGVGVGNAIMVIASAAILINLVKL